jgi:apolipoprotein N-acyltransferase
VKYIWEHETDHSEDLNVLRNLILKYPRLNVLIGASTEKLYEQGEKVSVTARILRSSGDYAEYYDSYNTALQLDFTGKIQLYHKSKLVPGVEKMPWPALFKYIEKFAINLGGTSGSLGMQDNRVAFHTPNGQHASGPIVCYESIYGEYVGEYVKQGADFLAIITNDGWWGDTPGYKQHLAYATMRAIETRRSIVRSANTGISAIINQKGEIVTNTNWWQEATIKATINTNNQLTFYTKFGDYLGVTAIAIALLIVGLSFTKISFES